MLVRELNYSANTGGSTRILRVARPPLPPLPG